MSKMYIITGNYEYGAHEERVLSQPKRKLISSPHPIDKHVGMRVRLRRLMLGLSQDKLGERLGLTFQQIQKYEKGVNRVGASRLFELSKILDVPMQYFFDGIPQQPVPTGGFAEDDSALEPASEPTEDYTTLLATPEGMELYRAFSKITDTKVRRRVINLVRSLSDEAD